MADRTLRTGVEVDTDAAQRNLRKLGEQAKDTGRDLDKASGDTEKLEKASKDAAVDVDKLADELRNSGKTTKDFADDTDKAGDRIKDTYDTVESGAHGTASSIGEAFGEGGGLQSGLGSATEAIESFAEMFGPAGMLVSFIGGAAIGALTNFLNKSEEVSEAVKEDAKEIADELIENQGRITEAFATEQVVEFIKEMPRAYDAITDVTDGTKLLTKAHMGDIQAGRQLLSQLQSARADRQREIQLLRNAAQSTDGLTDAQRRRLQELEKEQKATDEAIKSTKHLIGKNDEAADTYGRVSHYADGATTSLLGVRDGFNIAAEAAKRANWQIQGSISRGQSSAQRAQADYFAGRYGTRPGNSASGGPVSAGVPTYVGEYGRELFVPETDGTIVSAPDLRRAGGAVTVVMNVTSNDPMRVASQTAAALRRYRFRNGA